jgi:hypothetical protein
VEEEAQIEENSFVKATGINETREFEFERKLNRCLGEESLESRINTKVFLMLCAESRQGCWE